MSSSLELEPGRQAAGELLLHLMAWQSAQDSLLDASNALAVGSMKLTLLCEAAPESALWASTAQSQDDIKRRVRELRCSVESGLTAVLPPHPGGTEEGLKERAARLDRRVLAGEAEMAFSLIAWDGTWRTIDSLREGQWFKIDGPVELMLSFDPRLAPALAARMSLRLGFKFSSVRCRYLCTDRGDEFVTGFELEHYCDTPRIAASDKNPEASFSSGLLLAIQKQCPHMLQLAPWIVGLGVGIRESWYRLTLT